MINSHDVPAGQVKGDLLKRAYIALIFAIRSTDGSTEQIADESWDLFRKVVALVVHEQLEESELVSAIRDQMDLVAERVGHLNGLAWDLRHSSEATKALVNAVVAQAPGTRYT